MPYFGLYFFAFFFLSMQGYLQHVQQGHWVSWGHDIPALSRHGLPQEEGARAARGGSFDGCLFVVVHAIITGTYSSCLFFCSCCLYIIHTKYARYNLWCIHNGVYVYVCTWLAVCRRLLGRGRLTERGQEKPLVLPREERTGALLGPHVTTMPCAARPGRPPPLKSGRAYGRLTALPRRRQPGWACR